MQNQTAGFLHKFFELNHRETDWFKYFSAKHPRDLLLYTQKNKWPDSWSCFGNKKESGIWKPGWWARSWWLIFLCAKKSRLKKGWNFQKSYKKRNLSRWRLGGASHSSNKVGSTIFIYSLFTYIQLLCLSLTPKASRSLNNTCVPTKLLNLQEGKSKHLLNPQW